MPSPANHAFMLFVLISLQMLTGKLGQQMALLYTTFFLFILDNHFTTLNLQNAQYLYHNITLSTATCFDPQGIIFREQNQSNIT
jgi:hypothetical protein